MKNNKKLEKLTFEERMFYYTHKHKGITSKQVWENYRVSKDKKDKTPRTFREHFSVYWWFLNKICKANVKWHIDKTGKPIFHNTKALHIYNKYIEPLSALISASILARNIISKGEPFGYLIFLEKFKYEVSIFHNTTIWNLEKDIKTICIHLEIKNNDLWHINKDQIKSCEKLEYKSSFLKKHKLTLWSLSRLKNMRYNTLTVDGSFLDSKHQKHPKGYSKIIDILDAYIIENGIKIKPDKTNKFLLSVFRHLWIWNDNFYSLDETPKNIKDKGFEAVGEHYRIYGKNKIFTSRWPLLHRFVKHYRKLEPKTTIEKKETFLQYLKRKLFGGGKV